MKTVHMDPAALLEMDGNPRVHPDSQVSALAVSIEKFGFLVPIVIDKDSHVLAGHARRLAAIKLGLSEVPCLVVEDDWTDERKRAYALVDNRMSDMSIWDMDNLKRELDYLQHFLDVDDFLSTYEMGELAEEAAKFQQEAAGTLSRLMADASKTQDMASARKKQDEMSDRHDRDVVTVTCPHCGESMTIDKDD